MILSTIARINAGGIADFQSKTKASVNMKPHIAVTIMCVMNAITKIVRNEVECFL